ncbi:FAD-binding oxidoreductase [Noviherbaspirillum sp. CPCC 100848]|uniref:FAD-binding oxidoreductase n=1 Tax=Noviherbaspirillum album TaxID=3080276 RepID=A0ABU6J2Z1_9BURK|nr:FAD-binding oxidoreductase [Noviherbaspirillum sp. CPCC 100848]MEC4717999.1 FAD-binding oxidoreductase [Noviherbaspirillum sp. CPCC 100848]
MNTANNPAAQLMASLAPFSPIHNKLDMERYLSDWSGLAGGYPLAVVRPRTTQEVAQIVKACHAAGQKLTIQGGLTGLAGGAVPDEGDMVISLERLNKVEELDVQGGTVTVQAGITLQGLADLVDAHDWYFPLDCGARGSCQIGGNVATNAGGNRVLRYGTMRELVLGLEVVLPDGTVLSMLNKVMKNNTGLDLKHLFIGSEGTLGVVTKVVLKLFPKPQRRYTAFCALESFERVTTLLKMARSSLPSLSAFEVMWDDYLHLASAALGRAKPFDTEYALYVLLEAEGVDSPEQEQALEKLLEMALESNVVSDVIMPQSNEQASQLWEMRDAIGELLANMKPYIAFDIGIPLSRMEDFIFQIKNAMQAHYPSAKHLFFGHLGDGNLHYATGPHRDEDIAPIDEFVYAAVEKVGGSISGEHGIGRLKKPFLKHSRSADEIALMRSIKQAVDRKSTLNTGRIIDQR